MPSFDVVSEIDRHELTNAVDQANREIDTRFDFKGTESRFVLDDDSIVSESQSEFQLQQMLDILQSKMAKRGIDIDCLTVQEPELTLSQARQRCVVRQGLDTETAKALIKALKSASLKVQASIQGDKVRVSGKKRDELQQAIATVKQAKLGLPLQFNNFRD